MPIYSFISNIIAVSSSSFRPLPAVKRTPGKTRRGTEIKTNSQRSFGINCLFPELNHKSCKIKVFLCAGMSIPIRITDARGIQHPIRPNKQLWSNGKAKNLT